MEEIKKEEVKQEKVEENRPDATPAPKAEEKQPVELNSTPAPTEKDKEVEEKSNAETKVAEPEAKNDVSKPVENAPVESKPEEKIIKSDVEEKEENGVTDLSIKELKFSQDDVNDLVGKTRIDTRNKTMEYIYNRYGVKNEEELDAMMNNAQKFDTLKGSYDKDIAAFKEQADASKAELEQIKEKTALLESGIDNARFEDAKLIIRGKGLPVTVENIKAESATHPEWIRHPETEALLNEASEPSEPSAKISVLGNDKPEAPVEDEEAEAMKLFHLNK